MRTLTRAAAFMVAFLMLMATAVNSVAERARADIHWKLGPAEILASGHQLVSTDGRFTLQMQSDGNLVLRHPGNLVSWASDTHTPQSVRVMQSDGNAVVRAPNGTPPWASGTSDAGPSTLELQTTDGRLAIHTADRTTSWSAP
jgi:hypothetical protein